MNYVNYWSLYLEFIKRFETVSYKGIPLALLSRFNAYLSPNVWDIVNSPVFEEYINSTLCDAKQIQPRFEKLIKKLQKKKHKRHPNGYVVINDELIRLPEDCLQTAFDKSNTILLTKKKSQQHDIYPFKKVVLEKYKKRRIIRKKLKIAKRIFATLNNHPIFSSKQLQNKFYRDIPKMIKMIDAVHRFYDQYRTSCVLVGTTQSLIPRTITIVGRQRGIPIICLQHGNIVGEPSFMPIFATVNAIHGEEEKKWYVQRGASTEQLEVTGHPRFDAIFANKTMTKEQFMKRLGIYNNTNKSFVLVATQSNLKASVYESIVKQIAKDPSIHVIIKPHPKELRRKDKKGYRERFYLYEQLAQNDDSVSLISHEMTLYDLLNNVDAVVIWCSTVGLEAMLFHKPVFMLDKQLPKSYYSSFKPLRPLIFERPKALATAVKTFFRSEKENDKLQRIIKNYIEEAYPVKRSGKALKKLITRVKSSRSSFEG